MLTKAERDEIRARADAATEGPWEARYDLLWSQLGHRLALFYLKTSDTQFCAHARDDIPALLDALDTQDAELARIGADKAYLFQANVANEWEERYECQERRIELMNAEIQRLTAENDRLVVIAKADEWQARYWAEHDAVADREATIMAERAQAAAMRRALEFIKDWFASLENGLGIDDPLTAMRKRFHAPIHECLDTALQPGAGKALLDAHAAELAEAKRDTARLFWLETSGAWEWAEWYIGRGIQPDGLGLRAAIDAAMEGK